MSRKRSSLRRDQSLYLHLGKELECDMARLTGQIRRENGEDIRYEIIEKLNPNWDWLEVTALGDPPRMRFYRRGVPLHAHSSYSPKNVCMKAPDVLEEL